MIISCLQGRHNIVMRCTIWYHLYNLKTVKKTHGRVLLLVKLQAKGCNFTKSNALLWMFFTFFKIVQIVPNWEKHLILQCALGDRES